MKAILLLSLFSLLIVVISTATTKKPSESNNPYNNPHLISMFDGKTLDGWTQSKKGMFVVLNGTMHSTGIDGGWIYKQEAGTFRWIFKVRQVKGNHPSNVIIWGTTKPAGLHALGAIQFQVPNGGHWDYRPGHDNDGGKLFKVHPHKNLDYKKWCQCELIANHTIGVAKLACCQIDSEQTCKATEFLEFTDPTAGRVGPIAIQIHNGGINEEYEGLYLETPVITKPGEFITV